MELETIIEIIPVEFELRRGRGQNPRIRRYFNIQYADEISLDRILWISKAIKTRRKIRVELVDNRYILWCYLGGKPSIFFDLLERNLKTTRDDLNGHGLSSCMHQASIFLRILQRFELASFTRITFTINFNRLGQTKNERDITYNAIEVAADRLGRK